MPRVVAGQFEAGKTCPFCQTPIKPGSHVQVCDACRIPHHVECWQQNLGCTTFGCRLAGSARGGQPPAPTPTYQPPYQTPYAQPPQPYSQQPPNPYGRPSYPPTVGIKDYLVEAILVTLFCCMPFGIVAIVYAAQARSAIAMGDWNSAQRASGSARAWVTASFVSGIVVGVIYFFIGVAGTIGGGY